MWKIIAVIYYFTLFVCVLISFLTVKDNVNFVFCAITSLKAKYIVTADVHKSITFPDSSPLVIFFKNYSVC